MKELQATMKNAFKGALQNGRQMRALVEEMALSAVKNGKIKEAKIAMEVLSVIKYGYTTSKTMDALKKEPMTIFSDKSLSWNKNAGVQFVTTALDKSIKTAFLGVGYGVTIAGNAIRLSGSKFNGKPGRLTGGRNAWRAQNDANRNATQAQRDANAAQIIDINNDVSRGGRIVEADVLASRAALEADITALNGDLAILQGEKDTFDADITTLTNEIDALETTRTQLGQEFVDIQNTKRELKMMRADIATERALLAGLVEPDLGIKKNIIAAKEIEAGKKQKEFDTKNKNIAAKITSWRNARTNKAAKEGQKAVKEGDRALKEAEISDTTRQINRKNGSLKMRKDRLGKFQEARDNVTMLNDQIAKRDAQLANWDNEHQDQFKELMAHWDYLETGSHVKSFALGRKSTKQKSFDTTKAAQMQAWQNNYQYAA
jgi:hypothetical protein